MKTVKIGKREYEKIRALAASRGQFLSYTINQAILKYLETERAGKVSEVRANG